MSNYKFIKRKYKFIICNEEDENTPRNDTKVQRIIEYARKSVEYMLIIIKIVSVIIELIKLLLMSIPLNTIKRVIFY